MKVPKARRMSSGNWYINLRLGGESINVTEATEKKCIKAAQLIKAEYLAGRREKAAASGSLTLSQAIDRYIASRENVLSPSTIGGYRAIQRGRFQSVMSRELSGINKDEWQRICNEESRLCSAKTLTNSWRFLASVIRESTGMTFDIRLPQIIQKDRPFLQPEEIKTFLALIRDDPAETAALLALCSLRRSEIIALRWRDVDLKNNCVHVNGAAVYDEHHKLIVKDETKNENSRRVVPIMPQLAALLSRQDRQCEFVVSIPMNTAYKRINTICRKNGLPEVGLHGLRHSFASLAYHLGISEKVAMEIGGWSNDQTMHKIYTHVARQDRLKSENAMQKYYESL